MDKYYIWPGKGKVEIITPPNWKAPSKKRNCVVKVLATGKTVCRNFRGLRKIRPSAPSAVKKKGE